MFVERKTIKTPDRNVSGKNAYTKEENVVPFLGGSTLDMCLKEMREKNKSEEEIESVSRLFTEIYSVIEAKQLQPMMRTQHRRSGLPDPAQQPLVTGPNLHMIMENAEGAFVPRIRFMASRPGPTRTSHRNDTVPTRRA